MGGKSSKSSQQIQIPPEVLARYNSVNANAETAAATPFQQYSTDPNAFVAPLNATQQAGITNANTYANAAQPYYQTATQQLGAAQSAASPYYGQATQQVGQAQDVGNLLGGASLGALAAGQAAANPLQQQAAYGLNAAYGQAQPFNRAAAGQYQQALGQGQNLTQGALGGVQGAYAGAQPFQGLASQYLGAGAQAVNPGDLGANQINQYMSPYIGNVLQGTAGMLNQQNQQAMSGQTGNAIKQGAFGGDRAGIAAANLAQQQQLANAQIYSGILNQGYGQALSAAQGQQQLGLGAQQANRAAQQQASQQALGIGQQGFGQGMSAAQQQAALGQQLYGMGSGTGQNLASLGQQIYGQGTGTAQQNAALGQQLFGQGTATSQQLANIGQQQFGQGITAAQQNAALGAGIYGMGSQTAQGLANLGTGAQGAGLQGAQAQLAAGLGQQQTEQAGNTALYNQFLQEKSYPFQTAQFLANIALGTGALSGSTTTTNQALGGFSDKRLKENIKPVGKTFDGQNIYSYNFKGERQAEIGLIAQEVEKKHPEAVGLAGGYKTVRYDKATDDAADRGHFAGGGAASMGGGVMPEHAGLGFADGGYAGFDPALMQQLMASYQQMYAPMQGQKGGLGAMGYVPEAIPANVGSLPTPPELAAPQSTGAQAANAVSTAKDINALGESFDLWGDEDTPAKRLNKSSKRTIKEHKDIYASGGLAGARHGYENGGSTDGEIVVEGKKPDDEIVVQAPRQPSPAPAPKNIDVPSATPAAAPLAQVAKVNQKDTSSKPSISTSSLNIPQIGNTVGLNSAAGLTPLEDHTVEDLTKIATLAMASDKRLKENMKPVGKTFDGQTVYSYNYKGEHQTRMGLIAQEVEKHHPKAVSKVGGYRMVDYRKATGLAAHRGHFSDGGDVNSTDDTSAFGGISIPMQANAVGLNGAAGLTPLKDNTLSAIAGIGQAAADFKNKEENNPETKKPDLALGGGVGFAAGGLAGGGGYNMFPDADSDNEIGVPDFNLDPEDIISGGDEQLESLLRQKPEPAKLTGLTPSNDGLAKFLQAMAVKPKPRGLAANEPALSSDKDNQLGLGTTSDLSAITRMIRGHEGTGKNPLSTAVAPYQMINSTFVNQFHKMYPDRASGMSDGAILALRRTPEGVALANRMGPQLIRDNANFLAVRGFQPNARNVYLAHFFGPADAVQVLSANPNTPIEQIVRNNVIRANPFLRGKSASGALDFAANAMAKQQRRLTAPGKAEGGLAGRNGYALMGAVDEDSGDMPQDLGDLLDSRIADEGARGGLSPNPLKSVAGSYNPRLIAAESAAGTPADPVTAGSPAAGLAAAARAAEAPRPDPVATDSVTAGLPEAPLADITVTAKKPAPATPTPVANRAPPQNAYGYGKQKPNVILGGNIPNFGHDYYSEPFFKGLKRGSAQSLIPLLTGLGTFATTPTRSMLSGILAGVGAGAQTYGTLAESRNKQLPVRQAAGAQWAQAAQAYSDKNFIPLGRGKYYYVPTGETINQDQYSQMVAEMRSGNSSIMFPQIPGGAQRYNAETDSTFTKPTPAIIPKIIPDTTSSAGIYATAYADPIVVKARDQIEAANQTIRDIKEALKDPAVAASTVAQQNLTAQREAAQIELTAATNIRNTRVEELTGVPVASLTASLQTVFTQSMQRATELVEQQQAMRPVYQAFLAIEKNGWVGGTAQGGWAKAADFIKNFGGLTEPQKQAIGNGSTDVSVLAILNAAGIAPEGVFDTNNPGPALQKFFNDYVKPRYADLDAQIRTIKPFTAPTGTPQSPIGLSPAIVPPNPNRPTREQGKQTQQGTDGIWRGSSEQAIQNDRNIPKGARYRFLDGQGVWREGVK